MEYHYSEYAVMDKTFIVNLAILLKVQRIFEEGTQRR